jgi:hypothetical protein
VRSIFYISFQVDKGNCIGYDFNQEFDKEGKEWFTLNNSP